MFQRPLQWACLPALVAMVLLGVGSASDLTDLRVAPKAPNKSTASRARWPGHNATLRQLCYSSDGTKVFSLSDDHIVRIRNAKTGKELTSFGGWKLQAVFDAFLLTPDEQTLIASGATGKPLEPKIAIYDLKTEKMVRDITFPKGFGRQPCLKPGNARTKEKTLLILGGSGDPVVLDFETGKQLHVLEIKRESEMMALSPDGKLLAIASRDLKKPPVVWDFTKQQVKQELTEINRRVSMLLFSPDGKELAVMLPGGVAFFEVGEKIRLKYLLDVALILVRPNAIAYSPDSGLLALVGGKPGVLLWDCKEKKFHADFFGKTDAAGSAVAFSPDGKTLAVGGGVAGKSDILLFDVPPLKKAKQ